MRVISNTNELFSHLHMCDQTEVLILRKEGFCVLGSVFPKMVHASQEELRASVEKVEELSMRFFRNELLKEWSAEQLTASAQLWEPLVKRLLVKLGFKSTYTSIRHLRVENISLLKTELQDLAASITMLATSPAQGLGSASTVNSHVQANFFQQFSTDFASLVFTKKVEGDYASQVRQQADKALFYQSSVARDFESHHVFGQKSTQETSLFWHELACMDMLACNLVYLAPIFDQFGQIEFMVKVEGFDSLIRYRYHTTFNLWRGILCCAFEPVRAPKNAPTILAFRGTQKYFGIPGFLSSMSSIFHRLGPGGNVLSNQSPGVAQLHEWIDHWGKEGKKVLLTGHSMGGNIAVDLFCSRPQDFVRAYTFGSPGRNERQQKVWDAMNCEDQRKLVQLVHSRDPLCHIGKKWLGQVFVVDFDESYEPSSIFDAITLFHSRPFFTVENLMIWKMGRLKDLMPGYPWVRFLHRMGGHFLYAPLKLLILTAEAVSKVVLRVMNFLGSNDKDLHLFFSRVFD